MISKRIIIPAVLLLFLSVISANAQQTNKPVEDTYFSDLNKDEDMKALKADQKPFTFSYGGWIESAYINLRSGDDSGTTKLASLLTIGKLWMKATLPLNSYIYLRGRDLFTYNIDKIEGSDTTENEPDIDAAFYSIPFMDNMLRFSAGRKYYILGTGLVFNGRGDGGEIDLFTEFLDLKLFGAYTGLLNKDTNPYRLSTSDISDDKGERVFAGGEISKSLYNQTVYALALMQIDKNDIDTKYNSQYYGLGLKGIFNDAFYYGEFIYEQGTSYNASNEKEDISAMAAIAGLNYFFNLKTRPALLLDYAYGSGDPDKDAANSPTGNNSGNDEGFMYFGTFIGGYALRPYLANLHIYRAGFAVTPFDSSNYLLLKRINVSAKYSYYRKENSSAINSDEADNSNKNVGQGCDFSLRWKIFSDLAFYANYGLFFPGAAYASGEKTRSFAMAGIYLSF